MKWLNKVAARPIDLVQGTGMAIKVVAVVYEGCWMAYLGPSSWSDEKVAEQGGQILEETALGLFPVFRWAGLPYREP